MSHRKNEQKRDVNADRRRLLVSAGYNMAFALICGMAASRLATRGASLWQDDRNGMAMLVVAMVLCSSVIGGLYIAKGVTDIRDWRRLSAKNNRQR